MFKFVQLWSSATTRWVRIRVADRKRLIDPACQYLGYVGVACELVQHVRDPYSPIRPVVGDYQNSADNADGSLPTQREPGRSAVGEQIDAAGRIDLDIIAGRVVPQALVENRYQ
jgi:hypothetical protein